jgi:prevent-host-death family protein
VRPAKTASAGEEQGNRKRAKRRSVDDHYGQNDYNGHLEGKLMAKWAVAEAKAKFSEVIETAQSNGPQEITKNGRPVAVVISMEEWKVEFGSSKPRGSLADFLRNSPLRGSGIRIGRVNLNPRPVKF